MRYNSYGMDYEKPKEREDSLSFKLLHYGVIVKDNTFETKRGDYRIRIIEMDGTLFFHKMKGGRVVEVLDLSKLASEARAKKEIELVKKGIGLKIFGNN